MGGEPATALNIVCFPKGKMDIEVLGEVLRGGADKVKESGAVIVGGHSIIDEEIKYGLAVDRHRPPRPHPAQYRLPGGRRAGADPSPWEPASPPPAVKRGQRLPGEHRAGHCLDGHPQQVRRRGHEGLRRPRLLGHHRLRPPGPRPGDDPSTAPSASSSKPHGYPCFRTSPNSPRSAGNLTGGCKRNREYLDGKTLIADSVSDALAEVALDPQTSGGLLIAVAEKDGEALVKALVDNDVPAAGHRRACDGAGGVRGCGLV